MKVVTPCDTDVTESLRERSRRCAGRALHAPPRPRPTTPDHARSRSRPARDIFLARFGQWPSAVGRASTSQPFRSNGSRGFDSPTQFRLGGPAVSALATSPCRYVGVPRACPEAAALAGARGPFVEEISASPYARGEEDDA